jgi:hypothetical protein
VDEPRPGHRLDHRPDRLSLQPRGQMTQTIGIGRRRRVLDHLAGIVDQADVEPTSTQIQTSVQHERWASSNSLLG